MSDKQEDPLESANRGLIVMVIVLIILVIGQAIRYLAPKIWNSFPDFVRVIWGDLGALALLAFVGLLGMAMGGGGCFIATAVYESSNHHHVITLKKFRDRILLKSWVGRLFVKFYYVIGPYAAKVISKNLWTKQKVRSLLSQLVNWLKRKYPELQT